MALITIEGPQIGSPEIRKHLMKRITEAAARNWGISEEDVVVLIKEQGGAHMRDSSQSLSRGGRILTER